MPPLHSDRVALYAQAFASLYPEQVFDTFEPLALGEGVRQDELQGEVSRVIAQMRQNDQAMYLRYIDRLIATQKS